jgi:DNA-binding CsgD family transcriptional regulator
MDDRFLQAMVYAMPDPVACVDERGIVRCFNKSAVALFLVDEDAVVGRALADVLSVKGGPTGVDDGARLAVARSDGVKLNLHVAISDAGHGHRFVVFANGDAPRDPRDELSPRQLEVLERLTSGLSEKQIAYELKLSQHTVHDYVKALYKRYGVMSRAELLATVLSPRGGNR